MDNDDTRIFVASLIKKSKQIFENNNPADYVKITGEMFISFSLGKSENFLAGRNNLYNLIFKKDKKIKRKCNQRIFDILDNLTPPFSKAFLKEITEESKHLKALFSFEKELVE